MRQLLEMAFKNLFRHLRRSLITMVSIASGLGFLLWTQSIMGGHNRSMISTVTSTSTGHVQIYRADYFKERMIGHFFDPATVLPALGAIPGALTAGRVHFPSIAAAGEESVQLDLVGIQPEEEGRITGLKRNLSQGSYLVTDPDPACPTRPIYIGAALAEKLKIGLGNKVVIMGQAADGTLGNELLRVVGIFDSKSPDFDKSFAFSTIECVSRIAAVTGVHEQVLRLPRDGGELEVRADLQSKLPPELRVTTWREAMPGVASMIRFNTAMIALITVILFSVITMGVVNAMLMNIFERTKEFGVMISLGATPGQVRALILFESLFLGVFSAVLGIGLGIAAVAYHAKFGFDLTPFLGSGDSAETGFRFNTLVRPTIEWWPFIRLVLVEIAFIVVAGIYPAYRASMLDPVKTLRG
jgi:ABC-type lipoprotein release transport system permease subunit